MLGLFRHRHPHATVPGGDKTERRIGKLTAKIAELGARPLDRTGEIELLAALHQAVDLVERELAKRAPSSL